jgi:sulfhydrogenase subunit beta (sulfur reductase)
MKVLTLEGQSAFFASLERRYQVRLPVLLADGTRTLGSPGDGPFALLGGALPGKPTAAFFPHSGPVFSAGVDGYQLPPAPPLPLFVLGFTPRDLDCLRFIDRFFGDGMLDDIYFRLRKTALIAGVSGYCGQAGALLPPAGGDCDLEFVWDRSRWLVIAYSETGRSIVEGLTDEAPDEALQRINEEAALLPQDDYAVIDEASRLLREDLVPESFWAEVGDRCIACTGCNLACPTCTCFGVQDWRYAEKTERSRIWDSCQLAGFMREASGHNPLGSEALRTRRRIHHKLAADPQKWGEISCFVCGRCDAVCPTGIGMQAVAREMVERFGR